MNTSCLCYREEIRRILTKAAGAVKDSKGYRAQLQKLVKLIHGSNLRYKTEWIEMLSLDDGVAYALLQCVPYMYITAGKLEKTVKKLSKLLNPEMVIGSGNTKYFDLLEEIKIKTRARYVKLLSNYVFRQ